MPIIASGSHIVFVSESWDTPDKRAAASYSVANIYGMWEVDPDDNSSIQFRIPKEKFGGSNDRIGMYFSGSGRIGIGTKNPETAFDVRDVAEDKSDREADNVDNRRESLLKLDRTANNVSIKATALKAARTIGGVSFDGSANINLPGVNTAGNQDTSGTAAEATILETARTIGGVSFNGSANINLPGVNTAGNQNTTGKASTAGAADSATTATYATKVGNKDSSLTFTVDRTNLVITDGRNRWVIEAAR
jgi:hypothetical protein